MRRLIFALYLLAAVPALAAQETTPGPVSAGALRASPPSAREPVPGTRVSIVPPPGFRPAERFVGFQQDDSGASLMVSELPAPADQLGAGFTAESLKAKGMELRSSTQVEVNGAKGLLADVAQSAFGIAFRKWILVFGDGQRSVLVTANFPADRAATLSEPLKAALLSARRDGSESRLLEGLPYRITVPAPFQLATRLQNDLLFTVDGAVPSKMTKVPFLVAGYSISALPVSDRAEFARNRLTATEGLAKLEHQSEDEVSLGGLAGRELLALAVDETSGEPLFVYQLILFEDGGGYFLVQGIGPRKDRESLSASFRSAGRSLEPASR